MCNNNDQTLFLAKITQVIKLLDEIDEMIENNPRKQQEVDFEISDYVHMLQHHGKEMTPEKKLELCDKLEDARIKREIYNNVFTLTQTYEKNKTKLPHKDGRSFIPTFFETTIKRLNQDYNYRTLDEETVKYYLSKDNEKEEKIVEKKTRNKLTKEMLEEKVKEGLKNKELAEFFGYTESTISHLKKLYGLGTRAYNRKK